MRLLGIHPQTQHRGTRGHGRAGAMSLEAEVLPREHRRRGVAARSGPRKCQGARPSSEAADLAPTGGMLVVRSLATAERAQMGCEVGPVMESPGSEDTAVPAAWERVHRRSPSDVFRRTGTVPREGWLCQVQPVGGTSPDTPSAFKTLSGRPHSEPHYRPPRAPRGAQPLPTAICRPARLAQCRAGNGHGRPYDASRRPPSL